MFKKLLLLCVLLGLAGGMAAASDRLIIATGAEGMYLDPRVATDVPSFERIYVIMEPLLSYATDLGLEPRLAESWTFSDDALAITFNLRQGVLFHHGREFVAEDVKYTFEWVLDPENDARNRPLYADIERIETPDDYTVIMHLSQANTFLLGNIARMQIVPYDLGEDPDFDLNAVGTGPYKLEEWRRDDRMLLSAFDDYWGGKPNVPYVEFRPIPEDATRLLAFEAGEIDLFQGNIQYDEIARLEADPDIIVQRMVGTGYTYMGYNTISPILSDVRVRKALNHLIPREGIVDQVMQGVGQAGISMIMPYMPWFAEDATVYDYNPEKARQLLADAGYEDGFSISLRTNENPIRIRTAEILQYEFGRVGIDLEVTIMEWGAFLTMIQETDDYELFILGWGGQMDPDRAMFRQFHSEGSHNYARWGNPRVDLIIDLGRITAPDSDLSFALYQEAQRIITEECPLAFIFYTEELGLHHPNIVGWEIHPYSAAPFQDLHLVEKLD